MPPVVCLEKFSHRFGLCLLSDSIHARNLGGLIQLKNTTRVDSCLEKYES